MAKNLEKENLVSKTELPYGKKIFYSAFIGGAFVLLICIGLCISFDLHQTKIISSELLPQMQADYETKIANLNAEIELLQREFIKLKSEHLSLDSLSEEYINSKLAEFKKNLLAEVPADTGEQILRDSSRISTIEKNIADLQKIQKDEQIMPQEILLAAGALTLRSLAENGENFTYEAEVMQIMAQGNPQAEKYVTELKKFSARPLSTKTALINEFKRIYIALSGTEVAAPQNPPKVEDATSAETWKNAFYTRLKNLVTFKTKTPKIVFEPTPDEVYDLVENGNLALALNKMKTDNKYAVLNSPILEAWKANVQQYLDFDSAINGLVMNALAHIRLKQFEQ